MEVAKFTNNLSNLLAKDTINDSDALHFVKTLVHLSKEIKTEGRFLTFGPIVKQWIGAYKQIFRDKEIEDSAIKCIRKSGKIFTEVFLSLMQTFNRHEPNHSLEFYCQWKLIMTEVYAEKRAKYVWRYGQQFKSLIENLRTATNRCDQLVILGVLLLYVENVSYNELSVLKEHSNVYILDKLAVVKKNPTSVMNQHSFLHDIDGLGHCIISLKLTKIICDELSFELNTSMYALWIDFNLRENSITLVAVSPKDNALTFLATLARPKLRERLSEDQELKICGPWSIMKRGQATIQKRTKISVYLPIHDRNAVWKAKVKSIFNFVFDQSIFSQSMSTQDNESTITDPRLAQFAVDDRRYRTVPQYPESYTSFSMSCSQILQRPFTPIARMQLDDDDINLPGIDLANSSATKTCAENISEVEGSKSELQESIGDPQDGPVGVWDKLSDHLSDGINDHLGDGINDHLSDEINDHLSDGINDRLSDGINDRLNDGINDRLSDGINDHLSDEINDHLSDGINDHLSDGINDHLSDGINDHLSDGINDHLSDEINDHLSDHSSGISVDNDMSVVDYEEFENGMDTNFGFSASSKNSFSSSNSYFSEVDECVKRFIEETPPVSQKQQPPNQHTDGNVSVAEMTHSMRNIIRSISPASSDKLFEDLRKPSSETRNSFQRQPITSTFSPIRTEHATNEVPGAVELANETMQTSPPKLNFKSNEMPPSENIDDIPAQCNLPQAHEHFADDMGDYDIDQDDNRSDAPVNLKSSKADAELTIDDDGMVFDGYGCVFANDYEVEDALYVYVENNGLEYLKSEAFKVANPERRRRSEREFRAILGMINGKFGHGTFSPNESDVCTSRGTAKRKSSNSSYGSICPNRTDISGESEQRHLPKKHKNSESSTGNGMSTGVSNVIAGKKSPIDNGESKADQCALTQLTALINYLKDFLDTREICGFHRLQLLQSIAKIQETNSRASNGQDIFSATVANIRTICRQAREYVSMVLRETTNNKDVVT